MFDVGLAGGRLCGRRLFARLLLVVSLVASFVLSFFPLGVLDGIWDLVGSVSKGCLTYSSESESELFTGDTSKDNHSPGPVIRGVRP